MIALVSGATGFIGRRLVSRLLTAGHRVRIFVRSAERAADLTAKGAELALGQITDGVALRNALTDVNTVYHIAGQLYRPGIPAAVYEDVHVEGTRALLGALDDRQQRRLVYCSTTGVHGVTGDRPVNELAPYRPTNDYERTKLEAERLVVCATRVRHVIIRPGLVFGPGDLHLLGLFRAVERGLFRPIGTRPVWLHPIYIDDLCDAFVHAGNDDRAIGETYNVAGKPATLREIAATIAWALGVREPSGILPAAVARGLALCGDVLPAAWRARAPLTTSRYSFLTSSRIYDVEKIRRQLAFSANTDLKTGMTAAVAWYRAMGLLSSRAKTA